MYKEKLKKTNKEIKKDALVRASFFARKSSKKNEKVATVYALKAKKYKKIPILGDIFFLKPLTDCIRYGIIISTNKKIMPDCKQTGQYKRKTEV